MATSEAALIEIAEQAGAERPAPGRSARRGGRRTAATRRSGRSRPALQGELQRFVAAHLEGWGHTEWLALLDELREQGHDTDDPDGLGRALERERVTAVLAGVRGLGPQRLRTLVEQYPSVWDLRQADAETLARAARLGRPLAERIREAVA